LTTPTARPTPTAAPSPAPHSVSLPARAQRQIVGADLRVVRTLSRTGPYTRSAITYRSGRLTISGIMVVPRGASPFPVVVLNHGYIDPDDYVSGQGLERTQDFLGRNGYVALHIDYRGHAGSDDAADTELELRLGYAEDAVNAVQAVKASRLPYLDRERVAYLGRSMGGGVTLQALILRPGLVDAAVLYASVSSDAVDNFERWTRRERGALAERIVRRYGSPERNPTFWRGVSAYPWFDRITEPVLVQHGTADPTCPIAWSRRTVRQLEARGKDVRLVEWPGEGHSFEAAFEPSMRLTLRFLGAALDS
jgi:dipeptidyl aminopeptidase/acylaminoacyl peptidase